ncbi:hypothetical protein CKO28_14420 [Rhodovibrio sodomensis]|uniref:Uncharacterized protein n=1 Tax=Rhodovibrio sodomensis TaxID=1088 RepID=A0ABS1DHA1_9PROT|nr:hypothetical protein [Rhodovibrio sodomensis]MBK1669229.1 hypothetical protein [Rhodovibrio sodomensis]
MLPLAVDVLGFGGFAMILVQSGLELHRRYRIECEESQIEGLRRQAGTDPHGSAEAALRVLEEVKAQLGRFRPWQGWLFLLGAVALTASYLLRVIQHALPAV